jgi:hypothetical protein
MIQLIACFVATIVQDFVFGLTQRVVVDCALSLVIPAAIGYSVCTSFSVLNNVAVS